MASRLARDAIACPCKWAGGHPFGKNTYSAMHSSQRHVGWQMVVTQQRQSCKVSHHSSSIKLSAAHDAARRHI